MTTRSFPTTHPIRTTVQCIGVPYESSTRFLRALAQTPFAAPAAVCLVVAVLTVVGWEREFYDTLHPPTDHTTKLCVVAMTVGKSVVTSMLLMTSHIVASGVGSRPERWIFNWPLVVFIALTSLSSLILAAYATSSMSWPSAVILNPLGFAPLFYLIAAPLAGGTWATPIKRLPRSALFITCVAIGAVCVGVVRAVADHSMTIRAPWRAGGEAIGEGVGCILAIVSGALMGVSWVLTERYVLHYPTTLLQTLSTAAFGEVLMLPLLILVDAIPVLGGSGGSLAASAEGLLTIHRSTLPASLIALVIVNVSLTVVVIPLLVRCPAAMVPMFSCGPLIAASCYPGPALPVVIGGVYAFVVIVLWLVAETEYDEDAIALLHRRAKPQCAMRKSGTFFVWRHGCSVLTTQVTFDSTQRAEGTESQDWLFAVVPGWREPLVHIFSLLGWVPTSLVYPGRVRYSASLLRSCRDTTRREYSALHRMAGVNES